MKAATEGYGAGSAVVPSECCTTVRSAYAVSHGGRKISIHSIPEPDAVFILYPIMKNPAIQVDPEAYGLVDLISR